MLANKGVSNHGEYFRSRLQELVLDNIQFVGENQMQLHFCIAKFFYIFNKFTNLQTMHLVSIQNAPHAIKSLATSSDRGYKTKLKNLKMQACILKEEQRDGWVVE